MNDDALRQQWLRLERKLDAVLDVQAEIARRSILEPTRRRLHRHAFWPAVDIAFGLVVAFVAGSFLPQSLGDWRLIGSAAVTMAGSVGLIVSSIIQLNLIGRIDWDGPVNPMQFELERLKIAKLRQRKWILLLAPLVGFCALIASIHALVGWIAGQPVNVLDKVDSTWVVANFAFGIVFAIFGHVAARWITAKFAGQGSWKRFLDNLAGRSLQQAKNDLQRWKDMTNG